MARDPGAHQGTGSRSQASPCLLAHRAERMGRAADRHRSTGGRKHALFDPYGGEKSEKNEPRRRRFRTPRPSRGGQKDGGRDIHSSDGLTQPKFGEKGKSPMY